MSEIINTLSAVLGTVMKWCYELVGSYGAGIILFTLITKLLLVPLNLLTQSNSIKMVKIKPELNALKIKYIDDKDKFTDEQVALYKRAKYNPLLGVVPLLIQIPIVLGLVGVIYTPLSSVLDIGSSDISALYDWLSRQDVSVSETLRQTEVIRQLKAGNVPPAEVSAGVAEQIRGFNSVFCGIDLGASPSLKNISVLVLIPVLAGLSALLLCAAQNRINVLQIDQSKAGKTATALFMIAFSTYFAFIVPTGVGLYWIFSNLFAIPSMMLTNLLMPPKKYIDYERLEEMKRQTRLKEEKRAETLKREKADYKRFFSVSGMKLMIYSEQNGFYKYYAGMIDYICEHSDIDIHYVTSDPDDEIFTDPREQIHPYLISSDKYLILLFMKLDCDMCIMTMPDLEKYHIKRSRVRRDIEYVYVSHGMGSFNLTLRKGALDWYDTVLCPCPSDVSEIQETEELRGLKRKTLVAAGYPLLDKMLEDYAGREKKENEKPMILIAPSWQPDNIIENGIERLLDAVNTDDRRIVVRPHPQAVRHSPETFELLKKQYAGTNVEIETDFSSNTSVLDADVLITDWSGICLEYAFTTLRPVLFINTPMKVMNEDYDKIKTVPVIIGLRDVIGRQLELGELDKASAVISEFLENRENYSRVIEKTRNECIFNVGRSKEVYGRYVIKRLKGSK